MALLRSPANPKRIAIGIECNDLERIVGDTVENKRRNRIKANFTCAPEQV
jgi:hypothetical protein